LRRAATAGCLAQASRANGCSFCEDLALATAVRKQIGTERFLALEEFQTSGLFTARERAGLAFTAEAVRDRHVSDATFAAAHAADAAQTVLGAQDVRGTNGTHSLHVLPTPGYEPWIEVDDAALRANAREVARVERIQPGDGVSYGRNYVASRPTWIATLPVGHADGFSRRAVNGGHVQIGGRSYPIIGAVSASHTIVELGQETSVAVGDVATLIGPDDPSIHPNTLAEAAGISVYDVLMHLTRLARR
jgi:hypothetical protein